MLTAKPGLTPRQTLRIATMKRRPKHRRRGQAKQRTRIKASSGAMEAPVSASQSPPRLPVPADHKRGISASFSLLDQRLCEVERWAEFRHWDSVLYEEHNTLTPEQGRRVLSEIAAIRAMLVQLRDALELEPTIGFVAWSIQASCAALCQNLVELDEKHLRRYGEVPPGLAEYLKPQLAELAERLQRISAVADEAPRSEQRP
jgi:hypothetical protein